MVRFGGGLIMKDYKFLPVLTLLLLIILPIFSSTAAPYQLQSTLLPENETNHLIEPPLSKPSFAISPDSPWFNEEWNYRKAHVIQGSTHGVLNEYQLRFEIHRGSGTDSDTIVYCGYNCTYTFEDLRFTDADGITLCDYWIEEIITSPERVAIVWVKIPTIPQYPNNTTMFMYYGNSHALSESDIDSTFDTACDMEEGNLSDWDGSWGLINHTASINYAHSETYSLSMTPAVGTPESSGRYINISNYDNYHAYRIWFYDTGSTTFEKVTNVVLTEGPLEEHKVYLGSHGHHSNYSYWDGGSWIETNISRTTGMHFFEFRHLDSTTYLFIDDLLVHTSTRLNETQLSQFRVYVYRGYPEASYFDDLIVRKWVSTEPSHLEWHPVEEISFQWSPSPQTQVVY